VRARAARDEGDLTHRDRIDHRDTVARLVRHIGLE
jgi:hypothetical protein